MDYSTWLPGDALYLDDVRIPADNHYFRWVIVRDYVAFCHYIKANGLPRMISFDHDLGEDVGIAKVARGMSKRQARREKKETLNGMDCAKWLVDYCLDTRQLMPHFTVHSANPAGAENILTLLNNLQKEQGQEANGYRTVW